MEETARGLETNEFLALLAEENSMGVLKENITLLLPIDKAVEEYEDFLAQQNGLGKRGVGGMEQITIKTQNPKCRIYWCLKGQFHEILDFRFIFESVSPKPLIILYHLGRFEFLSKVRGDIRSSKCTTGVFDTGGKSEKLSFFFKPVVHLHFRISPRIFEKIQNDLMLFWGAWGKMIHEKT